MTESLANSNKTCLTLHPWARWLPMRWLWRVTRRVPTWACRERSCVMGWRETRVRRWLRLLPHPAGLWLYVHLPRWATTADVSPDCTRCRRFMEASRAATRTRDIPPEVLPNARPI